MQQRLDRWTERAARGLARHTSRRSFLSAFGRVLIGAALLPLLPVMRGSQAVAAEPSAKAGTTDPNACEYWKYCAIDGFLCPGHVSVITGPAIYEFICREYRIPCVIAGFEGADMAAAIHHDAP